MPEAASCASIACTAALAKRKPVYCPCSAASAEPFTHTSYCVQPHSLKLSLVKWFCPPARKPLHASKPRAVGVYAWRHIPRCHLPTAAEKYGVAARLSAAGSNVRFKFRPSSCEKGMRLLRVDSSLKGQRPDNSDARVGLQYLYA